MPILWLLSLPAFVLMANDDMSDFDPVSDFLSREQEALGELGNEINLTRPSGASEGDDPVPLIHNEHQENGGFILLDSDAKPANSSTESPTSSPAPPEIKSSGESPIPREGNITGIFMNLNGSLNTSQRSLDHSEEKMEENESWREKFNERVLKKDEDEKKEMIKLKEDGAKDLENWYKHYRQQMEQRAKALRSKTCCEHNGGAEPCNSKPTVNDAQVWEKVCNMCDFQAKGKTGPDMTRMRSLLLSLKPCSS
ncbi:unnamed protein product [Calicophoron daubneyi]|uniref:Clathrin light chain n=1 Tax=Calicophoron daubneyi TaxID=300641 RepID=A0AAV2T2V6_CALDB